jgi:phosphotransferase system enzyme I (PtsI)
MGPLFIVQPLMTNVQQRPIAKQRVDKEVARYFKALKQAADQIRVLQKRLEEEDVLEGAAILDAQLEMLQDPLLTVEVEKKIKEKRVNAESIFTDILQGAMHRFDSLADPFFQGRFKEFQDIFRRVLHFLDRRLNLAKEPIPAGSIVFSKELTAAAIAEGASSQAVAFVTESEGVASHAAIVAKAKGIPYVTGILLEGIEACDQVIVDARSGEVIFNPTKETLDQYWDEKEKLERHFFKLQQINSLPAETVDGHRITLRANIDSLSEVSLCNRLGAEGIGLLRTEYLFLHRKTFPSVEEQFEVYRQFVEPMGKEGVVIRTFDFCQDKLSHPKISHEMNPYIGMRSLSQILSHPFLLKSQITAILRASPFGNVSLLFPMVSSVQEFREAKEIVRQAQGELGIREKVTVGCMIEIPSAAMIADLLAKECDFLSIGTNDLQHFCQGKERGAGGGANPFDPSIFRMIQLIVNLAKTVGVGVTVCGEMAADPRITPALLGFGVKELSCSLGMLPLVKNGIRSIRFKEAENIAKHVLELESGEAIESYLQEVYKKLVPDDCYFHC